MPLTRNLANPLTAPLTRAPVLPILLTVEGEPLLTVEGAVIGVELA